MSKKGSAAIIVIAVALALVVLGSFLINLAGRDCNSNKECPQNAYCGSDNECHEYPKNIVVEKNSYVPASIILSLGLVLTAFVHKTGRFPFQKKKE
ncbi:hypothetical protein HY495_02745 [Candidatus Woesearchaeota archaeon]|nr:hypothetical protein [Candidatus Woesearchaeota archaeon]